MRSRIAAVLTVGALLAATGGAIAVGESGATGGPLGGAANAQYKPGKGCGDKNHQHAGSRECPPKKKKKPKKRKSRGSAKARHQTARHKAKRKGKAKKKAPKPPWPACTITQQGQLLVAYCPG